MRIVYVAATVLCRQIKAEDKYNLGRPQPATSAQGRLSRIEDLWPTGSHPWLRRGNDKQEIYLIASGGCAIVTMCSSFLEG